MRKNNIYPKGFTLIEVTVTVVIIVMLAAISIPLYFTHVERGRGSAALENLHLMRSAEMLFMPENSGYTNNTALLQTYTSFSLNDGDWAYSLEGVTDDTFIAVATSLSPNPNYTGKRITIDQDSIIEFDGVDFASGGSWPP
jgi:prepilin-type N-terminal cleavage/methylation domain-containing protein